MFRSFLASLVWDSRELGRAPAALTGGTGKWRGVLSCILIGTSPTVKKSAMFSAMLLYSYCRGSDIFSAVARDEY